MRTRWLLLCVLLLPACSPDPATPPAAPPVAVPSVAPTAAPSPSPMARTARLTGDGIDTPTAVTTFGQTFDEVQPLLVAAFGEPSKDTGLGSRFSDYGACPGSKLRALEFYEGALVVLFGDVIGPGITMYQWSLVEPSTTAPKASALIGDVTTFDFGVGDTVAALRAGVQGGAEVEVIPAGAGFGPAFTLTDQSSGFFGFLTGTSDRDRVKRVQAGEGCGE